MAQPLANQKKTIREDTRSGFRAWIQQAVGSVPLARAWMKNGFSTRESIQQVLREMLEQQKKNEETTGPNTRNSHPELARQGQIARKRTNLSAMAVVLAWA